MQQKALGSEPAIQAAVPGVFWRVALYSVYMSWRKVLPLGSNTAAKAPGLRWSKRANRKRKKPKAAETLAPEALRSGRFRKAKYER